ncbi:GAF domain-containing protein [Methylobacterium sp. NEAU 140]|nr:GAF domain-containing protein [Methylobacterium sp. NEAU 140]MDP4025437.1 GAF domain-containing protein [Methylobacterium sp. NEAU 140]
MAGDADGPYGSLLDRAGARLDAAGSRDAVVAALRGTARGIIGSDGIAVVLRQGDTCFYAAEDAIEPLWTGRRFPLTACISGWAMLHRRTVTIADIEGDPRVPIDAYRRTSIRSLAMAPIGAPEPVAALGAYWCAAVDIDAATVGRLERLAALAAAALARLSFGGIELGARVAAAG